MTFYIYQQTTEWFRHFMRILISQKLSFTKIQPSRKFPNLQYLRLYLQQPFLNQQENDLRNYFMIPTKVWDWAGIKLATPGSAAWLPSATALQGLVDKKMFGVLCQNTIIFSIKRNKFITWRSISILVQILWKIIKLPSQNSMLGHHRPASERSFKWWFPGGQMMASFFLVVFGSSPSIKSGKPFWICTCMLYF